MKVQDNVVITLINVKINSYNGITLSTSAVSRIVYNDDDSEAVDLKNALLGGINDLTVDQIKVEQNLSNKGNKSFFIFFYLFFMYFYSVVVVENDPSKFNLINRQLLKNIREKNLGLGEKPDYITFLGQGFNLKSLSFFSTCGNCNHKVKEIRPHCWKCDYCVKELQTVRYNIIFK